MQVTSSIRGSTLTFTLNGRLDTTTVGILRERTQAADYSRAEKVIFDLRDTDYISSAGLRELLIVRKKFRSNDQVSIINVNEMILSIFQSSGFDQFLTISPMAADDGAAFLRHSYKDLLAAKVQAHPDGVFLTEGDQTYTWREIDMCSQIIASDLAKLGVKKGSHVAIGGANSVNWILTFFAAQKLGAIACLVNFNLGLRELVTLSQVGDITHFCCGEMPAARDHEAFSTALMSEQDSRVRHVYDIRSSICVKDRFAEYDAISRPFATVVLPDDLAVMIFTSGSTGRPKGVLLSAFNILNASNTHMNSIHQNEQDKVCLILPLFHIFGLLSGLCTSILANSAVIIPGSPKTDVLLSVLEQEACTIMHCVPSMMLALAGNRNFHSARVASLRSTILAGAAISETQLLMLREKFPNNHFSISYGLSEMAPITVTDYDDTVEHITKTVGKVVSGIEIQLLDPETKSLCAPGSGKSGEILVRGYNLMTCYYKLDIDDQSIDDEGWLHTGDLGFLDADGYLHLSGRLKEMIIRGGENIIPNEVASAISEHPDVADAKVIGVPDEFYGEQVAAALVMKDGCAFDEAALRQFLQSRLARFKIPAYFVVYEAFPMLSNGKVDGVTLKQQLIRLTAK